MKQVYNIVTILSCFLITSCINKMSGNLQKEWKVIKMEKLINVTATNKTTIPVDFNPEMSYHFKENNKIALVTQLGSKRMGKWFLKDSVLSITIQEQTLQFRIKKSTEDVLQLIHEDNIQYLKAIP